MHAVDRVLHHGRAGRGIPGLGEIDHLGGGRVPRDSRDRNAGRPHHAVGYVRDVTATISTQDARVLDPGIRGDPGNAGAIVGVRCRDTRDVRTVPPVGAARAPVAHVLGVAVPAVAVA